MLAEGRKLVWIKSAVMLAIFAAMFVALTRLLRAYSYDQIADALAQLSFPLAAGAIGVLVIKQAFQIAREWLSVSYARRADLALGKVALASLVARSLSTLGFSSITGVGLRLHIYEGWGLSAAEVSEIAVYDNAVFVVGLASQLGFALTFLPMPAGVTGSLPAPIVRVIGIAALALLGGYIAWTRRGRELRIRKLVIPVPTTPQLLGQIFLPVIDLALTALTVQLCLPGGLGLTYLDVVVICLLASVASSISQLPAGVGVVEGTTLLVVAQPDRTPSILAGLFVWRMITNLLPIAVGAILLVILEIRRHAKAAAPHPHTHTTATALAALTFAVGAIAMIAAATSHAGDLREVLAIAAGTGTLFVARGLQRRSKRAWQLAVGLVVVRAAVGLLIEPTLYVIAALAVVGSLLGLSRHVFTLEQHRLAPSPRWSIAAGMVLAATIWIAFVAQGRELTPLLSEETGAMLGVAAIACALAIARR